MPLWKTSSIATNVDHAQVAQAVAQCHTQLQCYQQALNQIVLDKPEQINLALCCLLANGHVLFEDLPGLGKTTLAQALSHLSGLHFQRIQFTSDLLPNDILGSNIFHPDSAKFEFRHGAIFSQVLLADEINRSSPKTQSALLEAMEEAMVSVEGVAYPLPKPFWVIATQNPVQQAGTYPLPESQLDRFLMRLSLGYPSAQAERALLQGEDRRQLLRSRAAILDQDSIIAMQQLCTQIIVSNAILDYLQALANWTRTKARGMSIRGLLALKHAAQAHALLAGRFYVIHEDVQAVFVAVVMHRTQLTLVELQQALHETAI
jgi:MoxR-like ATPase